MTVDYDYYQSNFGGRMIQEPAVFAQVSRTAVQWLDQMTFGRSESAPETAAIQDTVCMLCDAIYQHAETGRISSENVDGYSVHYVSQRLEDELLKIARLYLPAEYFYRGV